MALRNSNNVKGDLGEIEVSKKLLEHGLAINSLAASDTGWDLHCHVPKTLIMNASTVEAKRSWPMSGRSAHIQVKNSSAGRLNVGTVRGWLSGTASGVPTFMFWKPKKDSEIYWFSTPNDFSQWLGDLKAELSGEALLDDECHFRYLDAGKRTHRQAPLNTFKYIDIRFPSVLQLWTKYPLLALDYEDVTGWMNSEVEDKAEDDEFLQRIIEDLAVVFATFSGFRSDTEQQPLTEYVESLYEVAYGDVPENISRVERSVPDIEWALPTEKHPYIFGQVKTGLLHYIHKERYRESAETILRDLLRWKNTDATNQAHDLDD